MYSYSYRQDPRGDAKAVFINHEGSSCFVCWLYPHEVNEGETRSQAVDRLLAKAGYTDRADFWNCKTEGE